LKNEPALESLTFTYKFYNPSLWNTSIKASSKYEKFKSGDKVKQVYLKTPNRFGIDIIGFKSKYPKEFEEIFKIDYDLMFIKLLFSAIETFYKVVGWKLRKPNENVKIELEDFLS